MLATGRRQKLAKIVFHHGLIADHHVTRERGTYAAVSVWRFVEKQLDRSKLRFIDAHWRETRPQQIRRLAASLGYTGTDGAEASKFIENFIAETGKEPTHDDH
jgi:hypothetical protein